MKDSTNKGITVILFALMISHYVTNHNIGVFYEKLISAAKQITYYQASGIPDKSFHKPNNSN